MKLWLPANGRRLAGRKQERNPLGLHGIPLQSQNNTSVVKQARASQVTQPRRCVCAVWGRLLGNRGASVLCPSPSLYIKAYEPSYPSATHLQRTTVTFEKTHCNSNDAAGQARVNVSRCRSERYLQLLVSTGWLEDL